MDVVNATLISGIGGGVLGGLIAFLAMRHNTILHAKLTASANLRSAFLPTLHVLRPKLKFNESDNSEHLNEHFEKHSIVVTQFMPFLPPWDREDFNKAWHKYYGYRGDQYDVYLEQYSGFSEEGINPKSNQTQIDRNKLAYERIIAILAFAEEAEI